MEMEIEELKRQRDLAQSQAEELRRKLQEEQLVCISFSIYLCIYPSCTYTHPRTCIHKHTDTIHKKSLLPFLDLLQDFNPLESPNRVKKCLSFSEAPSQKVEIARADRTRITMGQQTMRQSSTAPFTLMHEIRKLEQLQEQLGDEANRALEVLQKEVACHRLGNQDAAETIARLQAEIREMCLVRSVQKEVEVGDVIAPHKSISANLKEEITKLHSQGSTIAGLEEQLENVQKSIDKLVLSLPSNKCQQPNNEKNHKYKSQSKKKKKPLTSSTSPNIQNLIRSPCSPISSTRQVLQSEIENKDPQNDDIASGAIFQGSEKDTPTKSEDGDISSREGTPCFQRSSSVNMRKMQKMFQNAAEENVRSIRAYVTELKERVAKLQYQKQLLVCQVCIGSYSCFQASLIQLAHDVIGTLTVNFTTRS